MLVAAALSFAAGIWFQALYPCPLGAISLTLLLLLALVPFLISRARRVALGLMIFLFACAGMFRLGVVTMTDAPVAPADGKALYEGLVVEASPKTKIVMIERPESLRGVKVMVRDEGGGDINDRVRIFGEMRELALTFNNPYLISWKWLKRLEGVSYEIKGTVISTTPGAGYIHAWRNLLKKRIEASGASHQGVIKALTIGDTTALDDETKTLFLRTGTSHILAISGSNIGIVTAFFFFLARLIIRRSTRLRQRGDDIRFAALVSIPFAFMFMVTAGSSIPTIRATIMITVFMLALFFERSKHRINTIAVSALVILLIYPHSLFSPSFQLTFMSILFIVICTERFYPMIRIENKPARWFASSVLMTLAATIGTFPIVIYHFYGINPFSVLHNLIAIPPMCVVAMPMSLVGLILPWGEWLLRLSGAILGGTIGLLEHLNFGYIYPVVRPTVLECLLYFSLILSLIYIRARMVAAGLVFVLLPVSVGYACYAYQMRFNNAALCVHFLDVGLGDAMFVEAPQGVRILIDGGGQFRGDYDVGKSIITPFLLSRKVRTVDYVVNTHPHADHAGGLIHILRFFSVGHFVTGGYFLREAKFLDLLALLKEKGIPLEIWKDGEHRSFKGGMVMDVLNPGRGTSIENANNASLVLKLALHDTSFFLTGDIDREVEERLVLGGAPLKSNILKVPHHGSRFSSSLAFVRSVKPDLAVLSVGKGIRGLPGDDALSVYRSLSVPLLRTDKNGLIQVCSDGRTVSCRVFRKGE